MSEFFHIEFPSKILKVTNIKFLSLCTLLKREGWRREGGSVLNVQKKIKNKDKASTTKRNISSDFTFFLLLKLKERNFLMHQALYQKWRRRRNQKINIPFYVLFFFLKWNKYLQVYIKEIKFLALGFFFSVFCCFCFYCVCV